MKYEQRITKEDIALIQEDYIPDEIFDIHAHLYQASHYPVNEWSFLLGQDQLTSKEHQEALKKYMATTTVHGLYFGLPRISGHRTNINQWLLSDVETNATALSKVLWLVSPADDPSQLATVLNRPNVVGFKVYHCYSGLENTMEAKITDFAPEWMWELLNEVEGVLMLHIVRSEGIADAQNQADIVRLTRQYPRVRLVLAHIARSFNYRQARKGLQFLADIENVYVDTSAVGESNAFLMALKVLGPQRVLWGSDYPISEIRGKCITAGNNFHWIHPENEGASTKYTLVGIESLIALKEAIEDFGLRETDVNDLFLNNALRLLQPHYGDEVLPQAVDGLSRWQEAKAVICGGTGLMSKRAELFDDGVWPTYYTRAKGSSVWDLSGRRYIDFVGGIGISVLGYADERINKAVEKRILLGSNCSLANPEEITLAEKLLSLHPWAAKIRYARTGGESMAVAVRCARAARGKSGVAFCGYHGWHDWYLAANLGNDSALDGHLIPGLSPSGVPRELRGTAVPFTYNDIASFDQAWSKLGENMAAIVMEPMRSQYPTSEFMAHIHRFCARTGVVLIIDEITSGLRYGYPGAHHTLGWKPDLVVYGKAMSNGYPFGVVIGKKEIMEASEASFISSSYWTEGVGTSAALAVLERMENDKVQEKLWTKGQNFVERLQSIAAQFPACQLKIQGMPVSPQLVFMDATYAPQCKRVFIHSMLEHGILASTFMYLLEAHTSEDLDNYSTAFEATLNKLETMIISGSIGETPVSQSNHNGFARLT